MRRLTAWYCSKRSPPTLNPNMTFRYVLEDATKDSLVLVDELGKGTEVRAGAAIAAAVLEALDAAGCKVRRVQARICSSMHTDISNSESQRCSSP